MKRLAVASPVRPRAAVNTLGLELESGGPTEVTVSRASDAEWFADLVARAAVAVLFSMMAVRFGSDFFATGRLNGLLLLVSEGLVVALTVVRRSAHTLDRSVRARMLTTLSMLGPPLMQPGLVPALAPEALTVALSAAGLGVVIAGKVTLGRSFGLMPANRGVVSSGVYRIVRHPIYLGYLVTHGAFLIANPTGWNVLGLVVADVALMARAVCEEATLSRDDRYRAYQQQVRWRVCPGVF
jgi:protein-S-isoprenylcysteine O-methyltransferase Ste14